VSRYVVRSYFAGSSADSPLVDDDYFEPQTDAEALECFQPEGPTNVLVRLGENGEPDEEIAEIGVVLYGKPDDPGFFAEGGSNG
jgi:hypothetical protein